MELTTRIGLEVGDLTVGLVGKPPLVHLTSVGEASGTCRATREATPREPLTAAVAMEKW